MNKFEPIQKSALPSTFSDACEQLRDLQYLASGILKQMRIIGIDLIVYRYAQGRVVEAALPLSQHGDETVKVMASAAGCHLRTLYTAHQFYRAVGGQLGDLSDEALRAWCYQKEKEKGRISWNYCKKWAQKANSLDIEVQVEERLQDIESQAETPEGNVLDVAEEVARFSDSGTLTDDKAQEAHGVPVKAREVVQDARRQSLEISLAKPTRLENPAYLDHIRGKDCLACGAPAPCHAHHLDRGGMATKGPDAFTVPLCIRCHGRLHDIPERRFWDDKGGVNPWKAACGFMLVYFVEGIETPTMQPPPERAYVPTSQPTQGPFSRP